MTYAEIMTHSQLKLLRADCDETLVKYLAPWSYLGPSIYDVHKKSRFL